MIEIIRQYETQKALQRVLEESGLSIHFKTFEELIDSLTKLKKLSKVQFDRFVDKQTEIDNELNTENRKIFNIIEKLFTKKTEYQQNTKKLQTLREKDSVITQRIQHINDLYYKINNAFINAKTSKDKLDKKKTFADFGYTYESACAFIENLGLEPVLTPEDLKSFDPNKDKNFESFDDLVAIHITTFTPESSIKTSHSATKKDILKKFLSYSTTKNIKQPEDNVTLAGTTYYIPYQPFRNTIHFCINSPVDGGFAGASNWEYMKYAIFCPFNDIKNQIKCAVPQDTYITGDYIFTNNTVILCPIDEKEEIQKKNPTARIICYDSELHPEPIVDKTGTHQNYASAHLYAPFVLSNILGYKYLKTHEQYGFIDENETQKFKELALAEGYEYNMHSSSADHTIEESKWMIFKNAVVLLIIEKENLPLDAIQEDIYNSFFQNIDESLIEETLSFLKPVLEPEKFKKFVDTLKDLNKEISKIKDSSIPRNYSSLKTIIENYIQSNNNQLNM